MSNVYEMSFGYSYMPFICSCLLTWSIVSFYLNDFKLDNNTCIRYIQLSCLILIPLYIIYKTYSIYNYVNILTYVKDNNINVHGHVSLNKEAATELSKGISSVGSQIGLGASIVGVSAAIGKSITKSSIPPVQKAAIIGGGALIGGLVQSGLSHINRANALEAISKNSANNNSSSSTNTIVNKLLDDISSNTSPLEGLLLSIQGISRICFILIIILIIQLFIRLHIKESVNISILGNKLNMYINKLIVFNKKVNIIYIWLILFIILIGLAASGYFSTELYDNLDKYITTYNYIKNK
jgi:hypothetical protein